MEYRKIQCLRSEDQADRWSIIDEDGKAYPYSKLLKDRTVESWLSKGYAVGHTSFRNGQLEVWTFVK